MAKFSKAQYVILTKALKVAIRDGGDTRKGVVNAAARIGEALQVDNKAFDYQRFMAEVTGSRR